MGKDFANSPCVKYFACSMAVLLFLINAIGLIPTTGGKALNTILIICIVSWWVIVLLVIAVSCYIGMIVVVIREPVSELAPLSKEDNNTEGGNTDAHNNSVVVSTAKYIYHLVLVGN